MKERTMDALGKAEEYFVAVIEQEAYGNVVPSRTEELCYAVKGIAKIAKTKYFQYCKEKMGHRDGTISSHDIATDAMATSSNPRYTRQSH